MHFEKRQGYSLVIRFPFFEGFQKAVELKYSDHTLEVVDCHDECLFAIDFFQSDQVGVIVAPFSFDRSEDVFVDLLSLAIKFLILVITFVVLFDGICVFTAINLSSAICASRAQMFYRAGLAFGRTKFSELVTIAFSCLGMPGAGGVKGVALRTRIRIVLFVEGKFGNNIIRSGAFLVTIDNFCMRANCFDGSVFACLYFSSIVITFVEYCSKSVRL